MVEPKWITRKEVEFYQDLGIKMAGGLHGLRDTGLLDSALARPKNHYAYGEKDIFQLAACYAGGFNHTFHDGNKRVAFAMAGLFLEKNGYDLQPSKDDSHADMIVKLVEKKITSQDMAQHFKDHCRAIEKEKSTEQAQPPKKDWSKKADRPREIRKAPPINRDRDRSR